MTPIKPTDLMNITGGGNVAVGCNVTQQIVNKWGGTHVINPPTQQVPLE